MPITVGQDTAKTRKTLSAGGSTVAYYSIAAAEAAGLGDFSKLPAALRERRPERLVAPRESGERAFESRGIHGALEARDDRDVVDGVARLQPVEEPDPRPCLAVRFRR